MAVTGAEAAEKFTEPTATMYAELGKFVAVTLGTDPAPIWDAADILDRIDTWLGSHWGYTQHPGLASTTERWEAIREEAENGRQRARTAAAEPHPDSPTPTESAPTERENRPS